MYGVEITNGDGTGARQTVPHAYANPLNDIWGVVFRKAIGDPVEWMSAATAREKAAMVEAGGAIALAKMLRLAAEEADANMSPRQRW